MDGLERL